MRKITLITSLIIGLSAGLQAHEFDYQSVLNDKARPTADKERDINRKPDEILKLLNIKPGMTVVDYVAGRGYYSEIFARVLNNKGLLYSLKGRLQDRDLSKFSNIEVPQDLLLEDVTLPFDRIFTALNYHDLINRSSLDRTQLLKNIHSKLKDGGYFVVIDHNAKPGVGTDDTKSKHRVENTFVLNEVQKAGFVLDRSLSVLANPSDTFELKVHEGSIKGKTDRFVYRFKKR